MHARIKTVAFRGIDTIPVKVQVDVANGLPAMVIVGLADKAVAESRERARAVLASIGLALPPKRIAINLALADVVKGGAHYYLSTALGIGWSPSERCQPMPWTGRVSFASCRCMARSSLCRACCRQRWRRLARAWT